MAKIRPLQDRVVVRPQNEAKSAGGIIIPETSGERPTEGLVLEVGPGRMRESGTIQEIAVKKGDRVLYGKYAGTEIEVAGDKVVVMREDDIMAVIED